MSEEGESVTHRFDCSTVGPVPVASGYGSRTLTNTAAHTLQSNEDNDLRKLSETKVEVPETSDVNSGPTRGSDAETIGTKLSYFTGSTVPVMPKSKSRGTQIIPFTYSFRFHSLICRGSFCHQAQWEEASTYSFSRRLKENACGKIFACLRLQIKCKLNFLSRLNNRLY